MIKNLDAVGKRHLLLASLVLLFSALIFFLSTILPLFGEAGKATSLVPFINSSSVGMAFMGWAYFFSFVFALFFDIVDLFFLFHEGKVTRLWSIPSFLFPLVSGIFALFIAPVYHALFISCFIVALLGLSSFCFAK
jgi:hypothetical protein